MQKIYQFFLILFFGTFKVKINTLIDYNLENLKYFPENKMFTGYNSFFKDEKYEIINEKNHITLKIEIFGKIILKFLWFLISFSWVDYNLYYFIIVIIGSNIFTLMTQLKNIQTIKLGVKFIKLQIQKTNYFLTTKKISTFYKSYSIIKALEISDINKIIRIIEDIKYCYQNEDIDSILINLNDNYLKNNNINESELILKQITETFEQILRNISHQFEITKNIL
jgi:hypothetical protein